MWPFKKHVDQPTGALFNEEQLNDPRNLSYEEMNTELPFGAQIPDAFDIRARRMEPFNQGRTSSCTCQGVAGAIFETEGKLLSPRYAYSRIKTDPKYPSSRIDYGGYMIDPIKLKINEGICGYDLLPNDATGGDYEFITQEINDVQRESAARNKGGSYIYATTSRGSEAIFDATIRYMWEQKRPVVLGVTWKQRWSGYNKTRKTGVFPTRLVEGPGTGHVILAVAYKIIDGEPYVGCLNSWGKWWGDNGMVWFPRNYTKFYSPIAYIPPVKEKVLKIEKEVDVELPERNPDRERANMRELVPMVEKKFPMDVGITAQTRNKVARDKFGREKLMLIKAVSYLGWKFTDVINYLYAHSRGKIDTDAYNLNFKIYRKDYFKK